MFDVEHLAPLVLMLTFAAWVRARHASWFAPGPFFLLVWTVQFVLAFVVPEYHVWSPTLWWMLLTCFAFVIGSLVGQALGAKSSAPPHGDSSSSPVLTFPAPTATLIICSGMSLAYVFVAQALKVDLRMNEAPVPLWAQTFLVFHYTGPILGGMLFAGGALKGNRRWMALLPFVGPATLAIIYAGRTALGAPVLFWFAGFVAVSTLRIHGRVPLFSPKAMLIAGAVAAILIIIGVGIQHLRNVKEQSADLFDLTASYDKASIEGVSDEWPRFRFAVFGNVYSFSHYFERVWDYPAELQWGAVWFMGPLKLFNIAPRHTYEGFYVEWGIVSNVYTMFRGPIEDFGLAGSLLWWLALGILVGRAYASVFAGNIRWAWLLIWFYVDTAIIGGFFFRYNTIIVAHTLVAVYQRLMGVQWSEAQRSESNEGTIPLAELAPSQAG
jgi:oligosaccharide repeat unit polymerase